MPATLPGYLLADPVTIEAHRGPGAVFGPPMNVRAHVQHTSRLPSSGASGKAANPSEVTTTYTVWLRPGPTVPVGSRVTVRGLRCAAVQVDINDHPNVPGPSHIEIRAEHSTFLPTTTVTVLRGAPVEDSFGDLIDVDTIVATGLDAAVMEQEQTYSPPAEQRGGVVESYRIRLHAGTDVREGDRIRDDHTSTMYRVVEVTHARTTTGPELGTDDVMVVATRVAATSTSPD